MLLYFCTHALCMCPPLPLRSSCFVQCFVQCFGALVHMLYICVHRFLERARATTCLWGFCTHALVQGHDTLLGVLCITVTLSVCPPAPLARCGYTGGGAYVRIRQDTSAYAYVSIRQRMPTQVSIRITSAYVSTGVRIHILQHTSAHVSTLTHASAACAGH
jgi:hypothetical protein